MDNVDQWLDRRRRIALDGSSDVLTSDQLNPGTVSGQAFREEVSAAIAAGGAGVEISWAEVANKPSAFPPESHTHAIADVDGLQSELDGKQASGDYATSAELTSGLSGKADTAHTHAVADVDGLQAIIDDLQARVTALEGGTP